MKKWQNVRFRLLLVGLMALSALLNVACGGDKPAPHAGGAAAATTGADAGQLLVEAKRANTSHDVRSQEQILKRVVELAPAGEEGVEAERLLGRVCWRYYQQYDRAREHFQRAVHVRDKAATAWLDLAEMDVALGHYQHVREAAEAALSAATRPAEQFRARTKQAQAAVDEAVALRMGGGAAQTEALPGALVSLRQLVEEQPGWEAPSRLLLRAALLIGDGPAALTAWRSYYRADGGATAPNAIAGAGDVLARLLPSWHEPADTGLRVAIVSALGDSRLFKEAALVALDPRPADASRVLQQPHVRELVAYARSCDELTRRVDEYYRHTLLGEQNDRALDAAIEEVARKLWPQLAFATEQPPDYSWERFQAEVDQRFGALVNLGSTAGYHDLHMGHRIVDEERVVEQYGERATVRFVVLENMVSNGFQSWAWDSGSQHGGWASEETIVQVRQAYAGGARQAWLSVADEASRAVADREIRKETDLDSARASKDPTGYLPGLAMRLERQGDQQLLDRLRVQGLTGRQLQIAFLAEYDRAGQESSIFAHEGRHAIDKKGWFSWLTSDAEREYRAKLSEVVFAPEPRLGLGAIIDANIGDSTPHGRANLRVMQGLVQWMEAHGAEIRGLDRSLPALPQLDKLTDDQLRAAFRSMDPRAS